MISGKIVQIRGIIKQDVPLIYKWVNEEELMDLTGTLYPISEYEHEKWIEKVTCRSDMKLFTIYWNDKCIGTIGLKNIDYINSNAELFISIGERDITGVGTDAVTALTDFSFNHLNLHKLYLHVFESNKRAIRCYEKSGYRIEGKLKDHHFSKGRFEDVLVMGRIDSL